MKNTVSICLPIYNGDKYLRACLSSVVSQSYENLEILIVDDGSTDDSIAIIEEFQRNDARIKLVLNKQNLGLVGNWQRCIELATGSWIKFFFQDDLMHPHCIEKMLSACESNQLSACICSREFIIEDSADSFYKEFFTAGVYKLEETFTTSTVFTPQIISAIAKENLFNNFIGEPITLLFHKSILGTYGSYNVDLVQLVDYEFALRICLNIPSCFLPQKLVSFRVHGTSETSKRTSNQLKRLKTEFIEPLVLYHEYLFNRYFKPLRKSHNELLTLFKAAVYFYKRGLEEFQLPTQTKRYLFSKYKGLYLIAAAKVATDSLRKYKRTSNKATMP